MSNGDIFWVFITMDEWYSSNYEFLRYKFWMFLLFPILAELWSLTILYDPILHRTVCHWSSRDIKDFYYTLFWKKQQVRVFLALITMSDILQIMVFLMYSLECFSCFLYWHWATLLVSYDSLRCSTVWHWSPKDCEIYSFWKNRKRDFFGRFCM